jgi:hypothetical protein
MADTRKSSNASDSSVKSYNSLSNQEKESVAKKVEKANLFKRVEDIARLPKDQIKKNDTKAKLYRDLFGKDAHALGGKQHTRRHKKRKHHRKTIHRRK